ncbi:nuclear exosome regulator NRDE2 isoform X2 [Homalodisca vitripennis]|uniref:nuclear exosome regulator NRDE2 isoform X2 n=1 Tax=Homalodisca vitripennis TaxID=197043 RepID=UPI001EEB270D|nr:nuclear exosome regulator NRDE2 isoform X2 [Homalodisca vitripennis]
MSLFPAYSEILSEGRNEENKELGNILPITSEGQERSWLNNSSYTPAEPKDNIGSSHDEENKGKEIEKKCERSDSRYKKKKKRDKKDKSYRHKRKINKKSHLGNIQPNILENDPFYEDKKQERGNFLVDTLHRPAVPKYDKHSRYFKRYRYMKEKFKKERKVRRYFILVSRKDDNKSIDYNDDAGAKEEDLTRTTEDFNRKLANNPTDVDVWLQYIQFQDTVFDFEKIYRRNPMGGERVTSERKLAIVERAIQKNPASELLLEERLELCERLWPVDRLAEECVRALAQEPGNFAWWRSLIRTTRNSVARCTAPGVLQVFSKAISRISQLRLHRPDLVIEQDILRLLLECGLFLQQAGLWEQLWMLLQMYLSLSLTASGQFTVPAIQLDDKLREQEDSVVSSGLPLSVLWLRVEKLRAGYHFLPDPNCDSDPQRVVFSDDMSGLLQPVMSVELRLPLVVSCLVLLKVPLLPCRHSTLKCLGVLDISSAINNAETLLAAFYQSGISTPTDYLSGCEELVVEPQYMKQQPGQSEYLSWLVAVMQHCAELLPQTESVVVHVWTLRLYGLLCRRLGGEVVKHARTHAKQLLKQQQFRENLLLYAEYALLERETGDLAKACKVLETALNMPRSKTSEPELHYTLLSRRLVDCLLLKDHLTEKRLVDCLLLKDHLTEKDNVVRVLTSLVDEQPVSEVAVKRSLAKWQQQTAALVERYSPLAAEHLTVAMALTPHLLVEWLACHSVLLYVTQSVWEATSLLQHHIDLISCSPNTLGSLWVEQLSEVLVDLLYTHTLHTQSSYGPLRDTLVKAISMFPNNLTLLNILATIETRSGGGGTPLWKLVSHFPSSAPLARLVLVFVVRHRLASYIIEDSVGGTHYLKNLLRQLTSERKTRECPLILRLALQLAAVTESAVQIKATFYKCLQACPWVKAFYMDAVKFLPEELSEIQDLLIEKELRLHTTPEELEILRD